MKLVLTRDQMFGRVGHRPQTVQQRRARRRRRTARCALMRHEAHRRHLALRRVSPSRRARRSRMLYAVRRTSSRRTGSCSSTSARRRSCARRASRPASSRSSPRWTSWPYALGIDPLELRLRNHADNGPERGQAVLEQVAARVLPRAAPSGSAGRSATPEPRSMRDGRRLVGWGMATATYPTRQMASDAAAARARRRRPCCVHARHAGHRHRHLHGHDADRGRRARPAVRAVRFELGDTQCRRRRSRAAR